MASFKLAADLLDLMPKSKVDIFNLFIKRLKSLYGPLKHDPFKLC